MAKAKANTTQYSKRPPIVTVMGHVDHGKTSILDFIRKTNIQKKEYGGITQHIGAYQIDHKGEKITFIDTPGHAAFTQMRARGGKAADIVILVVAANEGVQPQTKEAISHAKAANTQIIVAINKMDMPGADAEKIKQMLAVENILVEDWGGNIISVETSAKTGDGVNDLLDSILAVAEILDLKTDEKGELEAIVIEAKIDKKRGITVSAIIKNGTLKVRDMINASGHEAKVRALTDENGKPLEKALPGMPIEILGFKSTPSAGDLIVEKGSELTLLAQNESKVEIIGQETKRTVGVIIKADTQGTLEAVKASLANLVTESAAADFSLKFILTSTGNISDSDVLLASNTKAIIVGFNTKIENSAYKLSEDLHVALKTYNTIYDLIDDARDLLEGTATKEEQKIKGRAQVIKLFKLPSGDIIAGCKVIAGSLKTGKTVKIYNKNPADLTDLDEPEYIGKIKKLKQGKDNVDISGKNNEVGVLLKPQFENIEKGHFLEIS